MQFESLKDLRAIHLGALWDELGRKDYPHFEEQPPVPNMIERFGRVLANKPPRFELLNLPPLARYFFVSDSRTEAIQVQQDRLTFNWRKLGDDAMYPRFGYIASKFGECAYAVERFLSREKLGSIRVDQAEVTYVNQISGKSIGTRMEKVLSVFSGQYTDGYLPEPERVSVDLVFPLKGDAKQYGRLYIRSETGTSSDAGLMDLRLIARGKPFGNDIKATLDFLALGRASIVHGFASITSKEKHKEWGRIDDVSDEQ